MILDKMLSGWFHNIQIEGQIVLHRTVYSTAQTFKGERTGIVFSLHSELDGTNSSGSYCSSICKFCLHGSLVLSKKE